jgi:hypothetical protein
VPHAEDLDFDDPRRRRAKGLALFTRLAGHDVTPEHLAAIDAADQAFLLR